jgi:DNA-binding SARP family transcriptional activator
MSTLLPHATGVTLNLLHGFQLRHADGLLKLPLGEQRVLAFLALHGRWVQRLFVAGSLWLESSEERANASLRTALWRLRRPDFQLVEATPTHLALAPNVAVDVREVSASAERAIRHTSNDDDLLELREAGDLLPDWYDEWVIIERERFRQRRLHALETLCETLTAQARFAEAADAALAAIAVEPLRESAHRALISMHLAEGNAGEAIHHYRLFSDLLQRQVGLDPSPHMQELVARLPIR